MRRPFAVLPLAFLAATSALAAPPAAAPAPTKHPAAAPAPTPAPAAATRDARTVPATAAPAPAAAVPALTLDDRTALGARLVVLERAGKPLGLGVILNGDGRVLTALSPLGDGRHIDARYSDGALVPARLGHADRAHDLALVVPQNGKHKLGLKASAAPAITLHGALGSFTAAGTKVAPGPELKPMGPVAVNGNDGKPFPEAITFTTAIAPLSIGGALIDSNGEAVALVTRACKKAPGPCAPVLVGTPVGVARDFLRSAPPTAAPAVPTLGIEAAPEDTGTARGLRVTRVHGAAGSALRAGANAQSADVIVALDGTPVTTREAFERGLEDRAVGDVVDLLVLGGGRYRHVTLIVGAANR